MTATVAGIGTEWGFARCWFATGPDRPKNLVPLYSPGSVLPALLIDPVRSTRGQPVTMVESAGEWPLLGTGMDWPPGASFAKHLGSLRIPLALMLANLGYDEKGISSNLRLAADWRVHLSDGSQCSLDPCTVIGRYGAASEGELSLRRSGKPERLVFSVPNATTHHEMSAILRSAGGRVRLIWRPVAALLAALDDKTQAIPPTNEDDQVLVLHAGPDGYEASLLHVLLSQGRAGPQLRVPGRPRFTPGRTNVRSAAVGLARLFKDRLEAHGSLSLGETWARVWGSVEGAKGSTMLHPGIAGPWDVVEGPHFEGPLGGFSTLTRSDLGEWYSASARAFRSECREMLTARPRVKAVILSGQFSARSDPLIESLIADAPGTPVLICAQDGQPRGAAIFGARESAHWATYMDYLPQMSLLTERNGEPEWTSVVDAQWVDAGEPLSKEVSGFKLRKPARDEVARVIHMAASVEGHETVRCTKDVIAFPASVADVDVPLSIRVEVQAATGEPQLIAVPGVELEELRLDWGKAEETHKTQAEYIASLPRAFPPLEPVLPASEWHIATKFHLIRMDDEAVTPCEYIERALPKLARGRDVADLLRVIRTHVIRRRWNAESKSWSALVGSEGKPSSKPGVIKELHGVLCEHLNPPGSMPRSNSAWPQRDVLKILAWTYCRRSDFVSMVRESVVDWKLNGPASAYINTVGCGMDEPEVMAAAIECITRELAAKLDRSQPGKKFTGVTNLARHLSWLVSRERDGTKLLSASEVTDCMERLRECLELMHRDHGYKVMFRFTLRAFLLLLMHRRHMPEFLDPDGPEVRRYERLLKSILADVKRMIELEVPDRRRAHAQPPHQRVVLDLECTIDYLRRRGTGSIIVEDGSEEEEDE